LPEFKDASVAPKAFGHPELRFARLLCLAIATAAQDPYREISDACSLAKGVKTFNGLGLASSSKMS
jgi:hypothetical protein